MKKPEVKSIVLIIYLQIILALYFWLLYPALAKPKGLAQTNVPSLSISGLREANTLFANKGKLWMEYPKEPDLSNYTFGQTDPIILSVEKSVFNPRGNTNRE